MSVHDENLPPERIYANITGWSAEQVDNDQLEYIRVDLYESLQAELQAAKANENYGWDSCREATKANDAEYKLRLSIQKDLAATKAELQQAQESRAMADQCLEMIRELLATKLDMTHTPPMMYPEAIAALVAMELQQAREALKQVSTALPVLRTTLSVAGCPEGARRASEMMETVREALSPQPPAQEEKSPAHKLAVKLGSHFLEHRPYNPTYP